VIEHACPFVEAPRVPRVNKAELLEVEMMAELMAEGAQECAERRDFLSNRRPHPHRERGTFELFGDCSPDSMLIRIRGVEKGRVESASRSRFRPLLLRLEFHSV
jgi:hypothetical protein